MRKDVLGKEWCNFQLRIYLRMTHTPLVRAPVSEVSAMLVATTHFLTPSGAFWKILACRSEGSCEYIGRTASGGESSRSDSRSGGEGGHIRSLFLYVHVFTHN